MEEGLITAQNVKNDAIYHYSIDS